jgi:hypothetical protein
MQSEQDEILYDCFICERRFQFGRYVYDGQYIPVWRANVCHKCRQKNWNGIDPAEHPEIVQLLKYRSVSIKLNSNGRIEIPPGGPPQKTPSKKVPGELSSAQEEPVSGLERVARRSGSE